MPRHRVGLSCVQAALKLLRQLSVSGFLTRYSLVVCVLAMVQPESRIATTGNSVVSFHLFPLSPLCAAVRSAAHVYTEIRYIMSALLVYISQ